MVGWCIAHSLFFSADSTLEVSQMSEKSLAPRECSPCSSGELRGSSIESGDTLMCRSYPHVVHTRFGKVGLL